MPNHVTHKMTFAAEHAERVFSSVCPDGQFSFEALVPQPPQLYYGNVSQEDEKDFKCNWYRWNIENWGTKWGAYSATCGLADDGAFIKFDTAWSVPYPILSAFNNRFQIPFEHRYYDEGANFWGVEAWGPDPHAGDHGLIVRLKKRLSDPSEQRTLCIELRGYDPEAEDEAA